MTDDLFDAEFADAARAIQRETVAHVVRQKTAAIIRKQSRLQLRRAKSEETLAAVLPDRLPAGYSAHIISAGDVDALSFVAHIAKHHRRLDEVLISSWCLDLPDIEWLEQQQSANRIGDLRFYCGDPARGRSESGRGSGQEA